MSPQPDDSQRPRKRARFASPIVSAIQAVASNPVEASVSFGPSSLDSEPLQDRPIRDKGKRKSLPPCVECERLQLQCDRKVPCKACLDRGCTNLCTGGSRRIALMNTEQLRTNVMLMSDRIQLLEQALEASHSKQSSHPHPLLIPELLGIKLTTDVDEVPTNVHLSMPSYTTVPSTEAPSSEDPNRSLAANRVSPDRSLYGEMVSLSEEWKASLQPSFPEELVELLSQNPVAGSSSHQNSRAHMKRCIHNLLPLRQGAQYLCNMAKDLAFWHHNPVPCETYLPVLVDDVYDTPPEAICPYRMASLFAVMAIGSHVSDNAPSAIQVGLLYHRLARVLLCEMSHGNTRPTAVDALIALFFMTLYLLMFYDEKEQLNLAGDILSISTQVSNQLDLERYKQLGKRMSLAGQKCRLLFWELVSVDAQLSLILGRPTTFPLQNIDNRMLLPSHSTSPTIFFEWRQQFVTRCATPTLQTVLSTPRPNYTTIASLDSLIRDFPIPSILRIPSRTESKASCHLTMQRAYASASRDILGLQLHRSYFLKVLNEPRSFNSTHPHIGSVLATFQNACQVVHSLEYAFDQEPRVSSRFPYLWSNTLAAAISLCTIIARMHSCPLATMSIPHVNKCIALFRRAKDTCSKATLFLPVLEDIFEKSQAILIKSSSMQEDGEHSGYGMRWLEFPLTAAFGDFGVGQNPSSIKATDPFTNVHPILMRLLKQMQARAMTRQTQNDRRNFPSQTSSYLESPGVINASETSSPSLNWDSGLGDMGPTLHSARNFSAFSSAPDHGPIPVYSPRHSAASPSSSTLIRPSNASPTNFPGGMASMGSTWPPANHAASPVGNTSDIYEPFYRSSEVLQPPEVDAPSFYGFDDMSWMS